MSRGPRHSRMNHSELRKLTAGGKCPVCDGSVSRSEYGDVMRRVMMSAELRAVVMRKDCT